ncbi:MAG: chloride channel protein [Phycisphaerales bacterium]|nr:chloride channel protein [Phycisphaerales bacterium]
MFFTLTRIVARGRVLTGRLLARLGFREDSILLLLAFIIGLLAAAAAVGFHESIQGLRHLLYGHDGGYFDLYGGGLWLLILFPAAGGLAVGLFSKFVMRQREGRGMIDVLESVLRTNGYIKKRTAIEKILTSAMTIGTGGSAGAEGPIVQIGASIASAVAELVRMPKQYMPVILGCGSAAGISAIFNSPIGGLLFTLEIILRDFSVRTITPIVVASVVANFATRAIFETFFQERFVAIFNLRPVIEKINATHGGAQLFDFGFSHIGHFAVLGLVCGAVGALFTVSMIWGEVFFSRLRLPKPLKPAIGGALLGLLGIIYILGSRGIPGVGLKPFTNYDMPSFFSDGYGAAMQLLGPWFYEGYWGTPWLLLALLAATVLIKIVATTCTLSSGGSGGIIAPSLFVGAVAGGCLGVFIKLATNFNALEPSVYALVGMAGVLAAVVHAPLASILILTEVTGQYEVVLPAMLCAFIATTTAQVLYRDSIYTFGLRRRGVRVGSTADITLLQRMTVEQVKLEPATFVRLQDPLQKLLKLIQDSGSNDFVVVDKGGFYAGMVVGDDIRTALLEHEAIPLLTVAEIMRPALPLLSVQDDLATVMDKFSQYDVSHLAVTVNHGSFKVIGLISRASLMTQYQRALEGR